MLYLEPLTKNNMLQLTSLDPLCGVSPKRKKIKHNIRQQLGGQQPDNIKPFNTLKKRPFNTGIQLGGQQPDNVLAQELDNNHRDVVLALPVQGLLRQVLCGCLGVLEVLDLIYSLLV